MFDFLVFLFATEIGFMPVDQISVSGDGYYHVEDAFFADVEFRIEAFDVIFVENKIGTKMQLGDYFSPYQIEYTLKAGFDLGQVAIFYEHTCLHPVLSQGQYVPGVYGGHDKIAIRVGNF